MSTTNGVEQKQKNRLLTRYLRKKESLSFLGNETVAEVILLSRLNQVRGSWLLLVVLEACGEQVVAGLGRRDNGRDV